ncbi:MAG: M48 family metallopeptidase [Deltaproteobacteria bacterium]|nr:M48 family metallopeptidase [Deltaproteobacteria bacterium]
MTNTVILLLCFLFVLASRHWLRSINLNHLKRHGAEIPPGFEGAIDAETLAKTTAYTLEQTRVNLIESAVNNLILFVFLFGGLLSLYDRWVSSLSHSFVVGGWLFFSFLALAQSLLDIPFSLYRTFGIENRYGFNTTTGRLWWADLFKSTAIALLLLSLLVSGALALVKWSPGFWWLWVWGSFAAVTIFLIYLSPYLIEPLFFKFSPVQEEGLEAEIRSMAEKAGVRVSRVMQVDASRRSRHSNAYFTGIGRVKRIVLFDTLLTQMNHREILAILAHEVGHWKKGHIWKRLLLIEAGGFLASYLVFRLLEWGGLPGLLGLAQSSFPAQLVILGFLASLAAFPLIPISSWLSRRDERQADQFACELSGAPDALASALINLSAENLTNLHPHPIYAKFYYSHPPVVERVNRLRRAVQKNEGAPPVQ